MYEVKVGSGGVISPVKHESPLQNRVVPKPISPRPVLIKESPKPKISAVRDMSQVTMSLGDEAEKRDYKPHHDKSAEKNHSSEYDQVRVQVSAEHTSSEVEKLRSDNFHLMDIIKNMAKRMDSIQEGMERFSTNVEAQMVLLNNRIKASENHINVRAPYSGEQDKQQAFYEINNIKQSLKRIKTDSPVKENYVSPLREKQYVPTNT